MTTENAPVLPFFPDSSNTFIKPLVIINDNVHVKFEPRECVVCLNQSQEYYDIFVSQTLETKLSLCSFLNRFSHADFSNENTPKFMCKLCFELVNVLERTELEYQKAKQSFDDIIKKNPLFNVKVGNVKTEVESKPVADDDNEIHLDTGFDSEDEPLAITKSKRQDHRVSSKHKSSKSSKDSKWTCKLCGVKGTGGSELEEAHIFNEHGLRLDDVEYIKKESFENESGEYMPIEIASIKQEIIGEEDDEDEDQDACIELFILNNLEKRKSKKKPESVKRKRGRPCKAKDPNDLQVKEPKEFHQCDLCRARFSTISRLERHKSLRHDSGPPYICEVCGAHYKHRRACEIHIKMHKGISDWKCEECNKLFPSKGAMMRHNNIHTGKANYQCDLCGKSFIHTSSFKMHKLTHTGLKPHKCETCGLALMTSSHLKRHQRIHSGEKRHECHTCGKRFSERYNLLAHSKSHEHPPSTQIPTPRPKPFRCPFCPERFDRKYLVERHCNVEHGRAPERPPPRPRNTMAKMLKQRASGSSIIDINQIKDSPDSKDSNGIEVKPAGLVSLRIMDDDTLSPQLVVRKEAWCIPTTRE